MSGVAEPGMSHRRPYASSVTGAVDWSNGVPAHLQIAGFIRDAIERGELPPGSRLADREQMGEQYDVSHMTVSKAMSVLRDEGLIVYKPGRGLFTAETRRAPDLTERTRPPRPEIRFDL